MTDTVPSWLKASAHGPSEDFSPQVRDFLERLDYRGNHVIIDELVLKIQEFKVSNDYNSEEIEGKGYLNFFKPLRMLQNYATLFSSRPNFKPKNILELGVWDGGSLAFWYEWLQPAKLVGIDQMDREDNSHFVQWVERKNLSQHVQTYWRTDQTDVKRLNEIVEKEFNGTIDLVIDDCSHFYLQTRISFEILFPFLQPGGLYIIEDWSGYHIKGRETPDRIERVPLSRIVLDLAEALGSETGIINKIYLYDDFITIERGNAPIPYYPDFTLGKFTYRIGKNMEQRLQQQLENSQQNELSLEAHIQQLDLASAVAKKAEKQSLQDYNQLKNQYQELQTWAIGMEQRLQNQPDINTPTSFKKRLQGILNKRQH